MPADDRDLVIVKKKGERAEVTYLLRREPGLIEVSGPRVINLKDPEWIVLRYFRPLERSIMRITDEAEQHAFMQMSDSYKFEPCTGLDDAFVERVRDMLLDASRFSIGARIAAKLHLEGLTLAQLCLLEKLPRFAEVPQPLLVEIENWLRDFERAGRLPKGLEQAAKQLLE